MAVRKTKAGVPTTTQPVTADELPVTRAMLGSVRTEVLQRIEQSREEAKADAQRLDSKIDALKAALMAEIQKVRPELKAEILDFKAEVRDVKAVIHDVKAVLHAVQARAARIELLVEEQKARDMIVLDGITALLSRQEQVEQRMANVNETLRTLIAARSAPNPA